jgi:hypothetical protein
VVSVAQRCVGCQCGICELVSSLAESKRRRPDRGIELIYSKPDQSLRAFADAFKLKRDK